jgi:hypothetical protein
MEYQVPNKNIYKYRNFQWGYEIISNNELFFEDPRKFEDINDCSINNVDFNVTDDDINAFFKRNGKNRKEKRENIRVYLKNKKKFSDTYRLEYANMLDNVRISCFSASPSIDQMWSKYADNYKGMCLHFNSRIEVLPIFPYTVNYCEPLPIFNFFKERDGILFNTIITKLKSKYSFENEIRLFHFAKIKKIHFNSALLISVILGCKTSSSDIKKVRELLKRNDLKHVVLKKATYNEGKIKIDEI